MVKFHFFLTTLLITYLFANAASGDLVFRDTIDTAVPNGITYVLTSDFLSATPSLSLNAASYDRTITSVTLLTARTNTAQGYDNFRFGFGQATDVDQFRTEAFGSAYLNGQSYEFAAQTTDLISPTTITDEMLGGFEVEELLFDNLNIQVEANLEFHLLTFNHKLTVSSDGVGLVFSSGTTWNDRFDNATTSGGLILNPDFPLDENEFAVTINGINSVPEPSSSLLLWSTLVLLSTRRLRT